MNNKLVVILGPTASGKTKLGVWLADRIDGEIISADSRQVYRNMDIGTGKDLTEYILPERNEPIRHHLIDIVDAGSEYNVAFFQRDFELALSNIKSRNKNSILCGGTGMYIEAILSNHQHTQVPINQALRDTIEGIENNVLLEKHKTIIQNQYPKADLSTRKRLIRAIEISTFLEKSSEKLIEKEPIENIVFGINLPSETRRKKISKRLYDRLHEGMIEEVERLLQQGVSAEKLIFYGLEYKFITEYLLGRLTYEEMFLRLEIAIHQFSKRQMTFFRSMEKKGIKINWLDGEQPTQFLVDEIMNRLNTNLI